MKEPYYARITLHHVPDWTKRERRNIANWLVKASKELLKDGGKYATTFRATYFGHKPNS